MGISTKESEQILQEEEKELEKEKALLDEFTKLPGDVKQLFIKYKKYFIDLFDINGNGKIDNNEIKTVLVALLSLAWGFVIEALKAWAFGEDEPKWDILITFIQYGGVPFVLFYWFKSVMDKRQRAQLLKEGQYEEKLQKKDEIIDKLQSDLNAEKEGRMQDKNKFEMQLMEKNLEVKAAKEIAAVLTEKFKVQ